MYCTNKDEQAYYVNLCKEQELEVIFLQSVIDTHFIQFLEYLIAISETQSFSKAAKKCFVSQPTLSFQLKKLEEYYDIKIFERHHKKVIITSTGIELLNKAKEILSQCQQFDELAKSIKAPLAGNI